VRELDHPVCEADTLMSDRAAAAGRQALAALSAVRERSDTLPCGDGPLEAVGRAMLKPMRGDGLDRNLPQIVDSLVAREIARRRSEAETRVAGMAFTSVRGRIVAVLQHLAQEHGEKAPDGSVRIRLRISHQELANLAGTTRETCTVELGRLMRTGLVEVDDDHFFVIPKPGRLQPGPIDRLRQVVVGGGKR